MKKTKKIIGALALVLSLSSTFVMAEVPKSSVILGNKGFSLQYANHSKNRVEIMDDLKEAQGKIFIKSANGTWFNNNGNKVEKNVISDIQYIDDEGNIKYYKEKDGEEYTPGEEKKEEGNNTENNTGGGIAPGGGDIGQENQAPKVKSAQLIISDGSTLKVDISERESGMLIGEVNVSGIGEKYLTGVKISVDQENTTLTVMGHDKTFTNKEIKITAEDEWIKQYDNGEPGVSLKKLKETAKYSEDGKTYSQNIYIENEQGKVRTIKLNMIVD